MKKTAIALLTFSAAMFAVSCQKENITGQSENTSKEEGMTICAVSEGIGSNSKAEMVYKYDVVWKKEDKICVKNASTKVEFTLTGGENTTKGRFSSDKSISGDVEGFYPSSIVTDGGLVWPAEQQIGQICPMYSKKNLSSTQNQTFSFTSLGSMFQIVFNTTQENITLKSIEIKDGNATLSGAFTVDADGKAVIAAEDKAGITLDLGEKGVALGKGANFFNIAIPAGNYQALTLTFTATDGAKCVFNNSKINVIHNTVGKLVLTGKTFIPDLPAGALPGVFTVADNGQGNVKKVYFSKGNLWADGDKALHFEANQYAFNSKYESSHVSHFTWSSTVADAVSEDCCSGSHLFCDEANKQSVDGSEPIYYALSTAEWLYLINNGSYTSDIRRNKCKWATVNGVGGYVIAPDDFTGTLKKTYANDAELATAGNLVFLPAAGNRYGFYLSSVGEYGGYWCSSEFDSDFASGLYFDSSDVDSGGDCDGDFGLCLRLITECQ